MFQHLKGGSELKICMESWPRRSPGIFVHSIRLGAKGSGRMPLRMIYVDGGVVIKIQTLDLKVNLHYHYITNKTVAKTHP